MSVEKNLPGQDLRALKSPPPSTLSNPLIACIEERPLMRECEFGLQAIFYRHSPVFEERLSAIFRLILRKKRPFRISRPETFSQIQY
jgi:hypothetical protein